MDGCFVEGRKRGAHHALLAHAQRLPANVHSGTGRNLVGKYRQLARENAELRQQLRQDHLGRLSAQLDIVTQHNRQLTQSNQSNAGEIEQAGTVCVCCSNAALLLQKCLAS